MREHGNIAAACEYALGAANDGQAALRIVGLLTQYFKAHGAWTFGRRLCERAIAGAPAVRTRERGLALMCLGVNLAMGEKSSATRRFSRRPAFAGNWATTGRQPIQADTMRCGLRIPAELRKQLRILRRPSASLGNWRTESWPVLPDWHAGGCT